MAIELGRGAKCMRVLFILLNIPILLTGFAIVGVGISLYPSSNNSGSVSCVNYKNGAAILIALGLFTALLSVLGVLAAVFTLRSLLGVFIGVLVLTIVGKIVAATIGAASVTSQLSSHLQNAINNSSKLTCIVTKAPTAMEVTYMVGGCGVAAGLFEALGILVACGLICCINSSEMKTSISVPTEPAAIKPDLELLAYNNFSSLSELRAPKHSKPESLDSVGYRGGRSRRGRDTPHG